MQKAHSNINWQNVPSTATPLNQTNLNAMDQAIDVIDDRVVAMDTSKADQTDMLLAVKNITLTNSTGVITITFFNGTTKTIDTKLEKIAVNFRYESNPESPNYQKLIIQLDDGSVQYVDLSTLITEYDFADTDTIATSIAGGTVTMNVKNGSITSEKLQPDYLSDITVQAQNAATAASASQGYAVLAESWAVGGTETRPGEDEQNSKAYADKAENIVATLLSNFGIDVVGARLVFGATFEESYTIAVTNSTLVFGNV